MYDVALRCRNHRAVCPLVITYRLSYRDLVAMMAERALSCRIRSIIVWVIRYVPEFEKTMERFARPVNTSWRVDEPTSSRGKWTYLYRLSTSTANGSIFCSVPIAVSLLLKHSSAMLFVAAFAAVAAQDNAPMA